jgi:hypothetical protein
MRLRRSLHRSRRGVAFRVVARTGVDANDLCRYGTRIDATPWGERNFNTLGLKEPWNVPRLKGAAAGHVLQRYERYTVSESKSGTSLVQLPLR